MSIIERAASAAELEIDGNRLATGAKRADYSNLIKAVREIEGSQQASEIAHQRRFEECAEALNKAQKRVHELEQQLLKHELDQRLRKVNVPDNDRVYVLGATCSPDDPQMKKLAETTT